MRRSVAAAVLVAASMVCVPATAENGKDGESKWAGYGSVGLGLVPRYDGSSTYQMLPYAEGRLNYGNYYARFEGGALRINILDSESFHFGPYVGVRRGRGNVTGPVRLMRDLDDSETAGAFIEWEHVAEDPRSGEYVMIAADDAVYGEKGGGWTVTLRANARRPLEFANPGLILSIEGDVIWASRPYMRTYFGVDPIDAAASGMPVFSPGSGFKTAGVALSLDQFLSRHFSVGLRGHYGRLLDDARESPVTAIAGSPDQFFAGVVFGVVL